MLCWFQPILRKEEGLLILDLKLVNLRAVLLTAMLAWWTMSLETPHQSCWLTQGVLMGERTRLTVHPPEPGVRIGSHLVQTSVYNKEISHTVLKHVFTLACIVADCGSSIWKPAITTRSELAIPSTSRVSKIRTCCALFLKHSQNIWVDSLRNTV